MTRSRNDLMLRVVETVFGVALLAVLVVTLSGGWFTSATRNFSDWYASQVSGLVDIDVVSTAVQLPQLSREDLPLPPAYGPAFSASRNNADTTPSRSAN